MSHAVKVGQIVKTKDCSWTVMRLHEHGIEAARQKDQYSDAQWIGFLLWSELILPEQPKAQPGAVYMGPHGNRYVGLADGTITWIAAKPEPFDPAAFTKVEE